MKITCDTLAAASELVDWIRSEIVDECPYLSGHKLNCPYERLWAAANDELNRWLQLRSNTSNKS